ncbi:MAG: hypothetical protein J3K34DRAFT_400882 [Monoraphidium minutum]|nr:MAG: hypothetical protein J3K34DRAFT_400882 [Monoraphidium minutum]
MAKQAGTCVWLLAAALVALCIQAASAAPKCSVNQASIQNTPFSIAYATESAYTYCFTLSDQALYAPNASLPAQSCVARNYTAMDCCASQADLTTPFKPLVIDFTTAASCAADRKGLRIFKKSFWSMYPAATKKSTNQVSGKFSDNKWAVTIKGKAAIGASKQLCVNIPQTDPNQCKTLAQLCGSGANCGVVITSTKSTISEQRGTKYCCVPTLVPLPAGARRDTRHRARACGGQGGSVRKTHGTARLWSQPGSGARRARRRGERPALTCNPGSGGNTATADCVPCQPGTYGSGLNATTPCTACANGTFANTTGAAKCSACPLGWTPNANQTACVQVMCPLGSGGNAATGACEPCQPGTAGSGLDSLTPCPACLNGTVTNTTGAAACNARAPDKISSAYNTGCSDPPVCQSSTLTAQSGIHALSPAPYGDNATCAGRCNIFILAAGDTRAEDVLTFYTVPSGSAADAANDSANIVTSVSGVFNAGIPIMSTVTGSMAVRFTSDQSGVGTGWSFTWAVVPAPPVAGTPPTCASRVINARQGSVSDGSGSEYYGDNERCTITIDTGCAGCSVQYAATGAVEDGYDILMLTVNGAIAFSQTGVFAVGPTVVAPPDGKLSLQFASDYSGIQTGWVFNWKVV